MIFLRNLVWLCLSFLCSGIPVNDTATNANQPVLVTIIDTVLTTSVVTCGPRIDATPHTKCPPTYSISTDAQAMNPSVPLPVTTGIILVSFCSGGMVLLDQSSTVFPPGSRAPLTLVSDIFSSYIRSSTTLSSTNLLSTTSGSTSKTLTPPTLTRYTPTSSSQTRSPTSSHTSQENTSDTPSTQLQSNGIASKATSTLTAAPPDFSVEHTSNILWSTNTWVTLTRDERETVLPVLVGCTGCGGNRGGLVLWNLPEQPDVSFQFSGFPKLPAFRMPCVPILKPCPLPPITEDMPHEQKDEQVTSSSQHTSVDSTSLQEPSQTQLTSMSTKAQSIPSTSTSSTSPITTTTTVSTQAWAQTSWPGTGTTSQSQSSSSYLV